MKKKDKNKNKMEHQKAKQKMFNDIFDEPFGQLEQQISYSSLMLPAFCNKSYPFIHFVILSILFTFTLAR